MPGLGGQVDGFEHGFVAIAVIVKVDVFKDDPSAGTHGQSQGFRSILDFRDSVENFIDALGGGQAVGPVIGQVGHHGKRRHGGEQVVGESHDRPDSQVPWMDCNPPAQMTMTMPILIQTVNAGDMLDMNCITRTDSSV